MPVPTSFTPTTAPAVPIPFGGGSASVPIMPSSFTPAFVELTGGGRSLSTLNSNASDATAARIFQGTVNGQLKSYQTRVGTDAQALPGIVRPANFNASTNAVVFCEL